MGWAPLENRRKSVDTKQCHGLVATPGALSPRVRRRTTALEIRVGLALVFGEAGVDCAVELVCLQLAFDICA